MSLLNVWVAPNWAMVSVDTEVRIERTGALAEGSKILAIPHANVVLALRGHNVFLSTVLSLVHQWGGDFDAIAESMPIHLGQAMGFLAANINALPKAARSSIYRQELVMAGYSPDLGVMCAKAWVQKSIDSGFSLQEVDQGYVAPWAESWGYPPDCDTADRMEFLARVQTCNVKAAYPDEPIGGRLLIAELTRGSLTFTSRGLT